MLKQNFKKEFNIRKGELGLKYGHLCLLPTNCKTDGSSYGFAGYTSSKSCHSGWNVDVKSNTSLKVGDTLFERQELLQQLLERQ